MPLSSLSAWPVDALQLMMLKDTALVSSETDGRLRLTELFGIVAFFGGFVCMLVNLRAVWTGARRWPAKTRSVVLTLSAFCVLWVALAFHLVSLGVNY